MSALSPGERGEDLIRSLGIEHPDEIDIEAIAYDSGITVSYEQLFGCEATLVGFENRAIATINPSSSRGRERFSLAHEIGHWHLHRGRSFQCRVDDQGANLASNQTIEREADTFASHLLMPNPLFNPIVKNLGKLPGFEQLEQIAMTFDTSLLATTIRLVNVNTVPVIVACYDGNAYQWHLAARDIPRRWWLKNELDEDSFSYDLVKHGTACPNLGKQSADVWFDTNDAEEFEVLEQCIPTFGNKVLVLLYLDNEEMLETDFVTMNRRS